MAAVVPSSDQTADLLQDLHLDSENKSLQARDSTKQVSSVQYAPVEPGTMANGMNKPFERPISPFNQDFTGPSMFYSPNGYTSPTYPSSTYYYGGYDGSSGNEWDGLASADGVEMPQGMQHPRASSAMGGYMNQMYPNNRMYGQYGNAFRSGLEFSPSIYDLRTGGRDWLVADYKYRPRGRGNGLFINSNESADGLNELNRGPRGKGFKDQKDSEPISLAVKGQSLPLKGNCDEDNLPLFPDREQYNKDDFPETYTDAKFFVIKSYSEDDIHKSIKYGVWASTPNGNKKLDAAYREAEEKSGGCPVFLLFSVNASGQFVGLAEMIGPVDFDKTVEYWQQDKWNGCFPVKWHIVKDVPNSTLRHITLENNENKPVTNSRDTQEVKSELGFQILKIFKTHSSKTCILDDFDFYEGRQKIMQEKKAKQRQLNKQVGNVNQSAALTQITEQDRPVDKEWSKIPASSGGSAGLPRSEDGELKPSEEIRSTTASKDQLNVKDNEVLLNGTGSAC
ncbi:YTH domain-containing protein ECT2-like isoform X2 [Nicotiana sylvestris]|uniref:YTH domain-containing family protein n=2 Tax=Nicotiana TaxID=4085 RepID=A0A1S3YMA2_TOBAC|nr:PREDICTED: uncharacterized protein LOC104243907 isoform X3 [Nicotiana sylvestris]XP_016453394.1 PREDICTED: uncharacterized protein LOC107777777 isoform X2 [Nicotiana tabacum]